MLDNWDIIAYLDMLFRGKIDVIVGSLVNMNFCRMVLLEPSKVICRTRVCCGLAADWVVHFTFSGSTVDLVSKEKRIILKL